MDIHLPAFNGQKGAFKNIGVFYCFVLASFFSTVSVFSECPPFSELRARITAEEPDASTTVDETCICSLFTDSKRKNHETVPLVQIYARHTPISDSLLFCAWRNLTGKENGSLFAAVLAGWKRHNPSLARKLRRLERLGSIRRIDTLCTILDSHGGLDAHILIRWIDTKEVLDDHHSIPPLLCRSIRGQPGLAHLALNRFRKILDGLSSPLADSLLNDFSRCHFTGADTAMIWSWIIESYGRKKLFTAQIDLVLMLEHDRMKLGEHLEALAEQRLKKKQYRAAVEAALLLVNKTPQKSGVRSRAAGILYKAYNALGEPDSARIWMEKTDISSEKELAAAVELYQHLGRHDSAASLIARMPPSIARDTLRIRHLLLSDSLEEAAGMIAQNGIPYRRLPQHYLIWQARTALFNGRPGLCAARIDSTGIRPEYAAASELMDYRYWLHRFADDGEALAKFTQIEYTLFKGNTKQAAKLLCSARLSSSAAWRLGVRIAYRQMDRSDSTAVSTLECTPAHKEPEYLLCLADAYFHNGVYTKVRSLLEKLILEFPVNIYTTRARVLLSRIP